MEYLLMSAELSLVSLLAIACFRSAPARWRLGVALAALPVAVLPWSMLPAIDHMALPAAAAALASGHFLIGPVFGIVGAFAGEGFSRVFHQHGDTHVDPPAAGIALTMVLVRILWPLPIA